MRNFVLALLFLSAAPLFAQVTNANCPAATGTAPHCVILTWVAPTTGASPTSYNVYTGGTAAGQCASLTGTNCTKIGSVAVPALTFTYNTSATVTLAEGSTHYFVITSANGTAESAPSVEVSAIIPFLVPNAPVTPTAVGK